MSAIDPQTDAEWSAKQDAETLRQYHAIKNNKKRKAAALKVLKAMAFADAAALKSTK